MPDCRNCGAELHGRFCHQYALTVGAILGVLLAATIKSVVRS
jgi:hypothetical protein